MTEPTPAELEATNTDTIEVTWREHIFRLPADIDSMPVDVLDAMENSKAYQACQIILGPKQWARFKAAKPTVSDLSQIMETWAEAVGLTVGE